MRSIIISILFAATAPAHPVAFEGAYDPESTLAHVQHLYASHMLKARIHPESPQTPAQKDYIRNWNVAR